MFPIGVGLGPIREGIDGIEGAGLDGAGGACLCGSDTVCVTETFDADIPPHDDEGLNRDSKTKRHVSVDIFLINNE